jgi:L-alanine-DL-glutamate epimerase-like enolase superfamily enzyme
LQPDTSRCGGLSEAWKVSQLAAQNNLGIATHTWSDAVAVVSNAHVVASCPTGITVEVDQTGNPNIEEVLSEPLRVENGVLE